MNSEIGAKSKKIFEKSLERQGLTVIGWYKVPTNSTILGMGARMSEPNIEQIFVNNASGYDSDKFELELMRARKCAEAENEKKGIRYVTIL